MILRARNFFRCSENTASRKKLLLPEKTVDEYGHIVYVQEEKLYPTLKEFTSSSNECLNKLGSPLAKWSEKSSWDWDEASDKLFSDEIKPPDKLFSDTSVQIESSPGEAEDFSRPPV